MAKKEVVTVLTKHDSSNYHDALEKNKIYRLNETIDYKDGSVEIKSILSKFTGKVTISSFDLGKTQQTKSSPFDNLIQILDGKAVITIDDISNTVNTGEIIIIPAHTRNRIKANSRFKMLSIIIKSGYEDVSF